MASSLLCRGSSSISRLDCWDQGCGMMSLHRDSFSFSLSCVRGARAPQHSLEPVTRGDGGGISLRNRAQELLTWPISLVHGRVHQSPAACSSSPQAIKHRFKCSQRENLVHAHSESDPSASPRLSPELWCWPRALWDADPCRVSCHSLCQRCHLSHLH